MSAPLRPLTLGELLDRTFSLYRSNFLLFIGIVALPQLLTLAANLWFVLLGGRTAGSVATMLFLLETLALGLMALLVMSIAQGAVVMAVSHLHLGRPATIAGSYSGLSGRMVTLCFTSISTGFLEGLATLLLIVPGVMLAMRWALVVPAVALENQSVGGAMSRSAELTKGHRWRIFTVFLLYIVLVIAFSAGWEVVQVVAFGSIRSNTLTPSLQIQIVSHVTSFITQCLLGPLITIAMALVYYDERVRKEAFDLEHMITELDAIAPSASATTA